MTVGYQRPAVRVALMGLGRSMFDTHYPVFRSHPALFDVVCACDLEKDRRDLVARDFPRCRMFRRFSDMLDENDIDLVDIATGSADHVRHAMMSLKKGFWTLLETPMALTMDEATLLKGAAVKAQNRLLVFHRGMFDPDYLLARQLMSDPRLGLIHRVRIHREDYLRRDDWQTVKRLGGGAAYYAMPDLVLQALKLMPVPPMKMWSELKRVASMGDAEDYAFVCLTTRTRFSLDIEFNGGMLKEVRSPAFVIYGDRGVFRVEPGASVGTLTVIDPDFKFPRRRSSVRTPELGDRHESFPVKTETVSLARATPSGDNVFWRHVYDTVRTAAPFPFTLEDSIETVKFTQLMKKASAFGK